MAHIRGSRIAMGLHDELGSTGGMTISPYVLSQSFLYTTQPASTNTWLRFRLQDKCDSIAAGTARVRAECGKGFFESFALNDDARTCGGIFESEIEYLIWVVGSQFTSCDDAAFAQPANRLR